MANLSCKLDSSIFLVPFPLYTAQQIHVFSGKAQKQANPSPYLNGFKQPRKTIHYMDVGMESCP